MPPDSTRCATITSIAVQIQLYFPLLPFPVDIHTQLWTLQQKMHTFMTFVQTLKCREQPVEEESEEHMQWRCLHIYKYHIHWLTHTESHQHHYKHHPQHHLFHQGRLQPAALQPATATGHRHRCHSKAMPTRPKRLQRTVLFAIRAHCALGLKVCAPPSRELACPA